ncbi:hypothetical protein ABI061_13370, partial [Enterococcus faecium]
KNIVLLTEINGFFDASLLHNYMDVIRIIITNLIVITIGITTLTNKALISSMILIVFDFIIIYSLLFLIKKVTEYLNR